MAGRKMAWLAACVLVLGLTACSPADRPPMPRPADQPYRGPLYLSPEDATNDAERLAGAAGRVVQCTTRVSGQSPVVYDGQPAGTTPQDAMAVGFREYMLDALTGADLERTDGDRALFTDRYDGVARQALIMVNRPDRSGKPAWYLESWGRCDWSEFPMARTRELEITIWTDKEGRPAPTYQIVSHPGPSHCDQDRMTFVDVGDTSYATRVESSMVGSFFAEKDRARVRLPLDAVDTGFHFEGTQLWLSADGQRAFLLERGRRAGAMLPRLIQPMLCA
jgi:hypothetical protein